MLWYLVYNLTRITRKNVAMSLSNAQMASLMALQDDEDAAVAEADAFCAGYLSFRDGKPQPTDPVKAEGWLDAQRASRVRVVMPARPEGYYHAPLGTFD